MDLSIPNLYCGEESIVSRAPMEGKTEIEKLQYLGSVFFAMCMHEQTGDLITSRRPEYVPFTRCKTDSPLDILKTNS